jgi:hypothetical protein
MTYVPEENDSKFPFLSLQGDESTGLAQLQEVVIN